MKKIVKPREIGKYYPDKGYLLICQWSDCLKMAGIFYSKRPEARFCCDQCRYRYHNEQNRERRAYSRKDFKLFINNEKILNRLYGLFGSKPLSDDLLQSHGFNPDAPSTPVRSEHSGRSGDLFVQFIICHNRDKNLFQIYHRDNFDTAL